MKQSVEGICNGSQGMPAHEVAAALALPVVGLVVPDLGVHGVVDRDVVPLRWSLHSKVIQGF